MANTTAITNRFQITLNRILDLLIFTFYRTGGVPEYQYSISRQECLENPEIIDLFKEVSENWNRDY